VHEAAGIRQRASAQAAGRAEMKVKSRKRGSLKIDIHCHYLNQAVAAKVAHLNPAQYEPSVCFANTMTREVNVKQMKDRAPMLTDIAVRLKHMDRMGVDIQAVSPAPNQLYYWTEAGMGQELARSVNEGIAKVVADHPDRFVGLGTVPLQDPDLAVSELHHAMRTLGLRGVEISPNVNGKEVSRSGLDKFFAAAEKLGAVIFMHPIGYTDGSRLMDHYFNNVIGNPLETTVATAHLIFDGVMEKHPKLKIVLPHAGGYLAHYWARMDHAWKARPDCRTVIREKPSKSLEKFYFDTIAFDPGMLQHLIERFGADHVLLGTDYPYDMGMEDPVGFINKVSKLSARDKSRVMGGNAARLLGITVG
jgi:aminocarboxymuconate-semialdehyde decarboxylase